jgi:hypothetical protein
MTLCAETYRGIQVIGNIEFVHKVRRALRKALLTPASKFILCIKRIVQGNANVMSIASACASEKTVTINKWQTCRIPELSSVLAHEGVHIMERHIGPSTPEIEKVAMTGENVLRQALGLSLRDPNDFSPWLA